MATHFSPAFSALPEWPLRFAPVIIRLEQKHRDSPQPAEAI